MSPNRIVTTLQEILLQERRARPFFFLRWEVTAELLLCHQPENSGFLNMC